MNKVLAIASCALALAGLGTGVASAASAKASSPPAAAQSNAREMARDYLEYSAFSRSGLIDQLVYEGFSRRIAIYGSPTRARTGSSRPSGWPATTSTTPRSLVPV
jgi:hypothetical protein